MIAEEDLGEGLVVETTTDAGAPAPSADLGVVAHELRTPLAMIRGWAELLGEDADPAVVERAVPGILLQVDRLTRLADDVLDAARVASGRLRLEPLTVGLGEAVRAIVDARPAPVDVRVLDDPLVRTDPQRLGQVVDNLLQNARRHGDGPVRVTVRCADGWGEVVVSSAGAPITPKFAANLFEPYERGNAVADGVGLGLYVCRSLISAHGGRMGLRVDDDTNHFWFKLPVVED